MVATWQEKKNFTIKAVTFLAIAEAVEEALTQLVK